MQTTIEAKRKPGPVPGTDKRQYTVMIEPELGDWGKTQKGGLSDLLRRLLREEKSRHEAANGRHD